MFLKANKASNILFIFVNIYFKLKYCIVSSITERKNIKQLPKFILQLLYNHGILNINIFPLNLFLNH